MSEWLLWFAAGWVLVMVPIWVAIRWLGAVLRWYETNPFRPKPFHVRLFDRMSP